MENDSGMIIILTVLIVSAFLLIIYKLAEIICSGSRISSADNEWVSEKSLQTCVMLQKLNTVLKQMISE